MGMFTASLSPILDCVREREEEEEEEQQQHTHTQNNNNNKHTKYDNNI